MSPVTRIRSGRRIPTFLWVPSTFGTIYKVEVVRADNTVDDITDFIFSGEIIDGVTDTIGSFEFLIENGDETRTGIWSGNEVFNFYTDYATSATTKRFRGRIEKVSYQNNAIKITGRSESAKLLGITVTQAFDNVETSVILKSLFTIYASTFTVTNVKVSTTNASFNWYQKPFWECVQDLCHSADFDAYIDSSLDCHYFESGTVNNTTDAAVHDSNLIEVGDFAQDFSLVKNQVIVYGSEIEGLPLIKTAFDQASINANGLKELIIEDSNIVTETQAQEKADFELNLSKDPPIVGDVTCVGLATIQPGERIQISAPASNLPPDFYKIISYKHKIEGFMKTILSIEKEPRKVYHVLRDTISAGQKLSEKTNPNEMKFSIIEPFNLESGTHSSTEITEGRLKLASGSSGNWTSDQTTTSKNVAAVELRVNGETLPGTTYSVTTDGGITFQTISSLNTQVNMSPPGKKIKTKITFASADTQITSYALLYKT